MVEVKVCDGCNKSFVSDEPWKRKCILCWKKESKYALTKSDSAYELMQNAFDDAIKKMKDAELKAERATAAFRRLRDRPDDMSLDRVTQLIKLCHPDRHANSEAATDATRWLLETRTRLKDKEPK